MTRRFPNFTFTAIACVLLAGATLTVRAQQPEAAVLRTDPVVFLKAIDGDVSRGIPPMAALRDREAMLAPGPHTLKVCFDNSTSFNNGAFVTYVRSVCDLDREIVLDAQAGRLYRLKIELHANDWKTWFEDVTESEPRLFAQPAEPKSKGGGKSLILLRMVPGDVSASVGAGQIEHIWFVPGMWGNFMMSGDAAAGFLSRKVSSGATVAIVDFNTPSTGLIPRKTEFLCGDTRIPVLDNVPGGGAYYLGEFSFKATANGPRIEVTHDGLETARDYLKKTDAKLADKLQHASLQWKRLPSICPANPREILRIDPGQVSPPFAAAGSASTR
jgi:hypothetical protein